MLCALRLLNFAKMEDVLNYIIRRNRGPNGIDHNLIRRVILNDIFPYQIEIPIRDPFDLDNIEDKYIKLFFRFDRNDIRRLARALRIPEVIRNTKTNLTN